MEKIWFVFNQDHHTGPFSSEEMFRMFYDDVISEESLIWKEGLGGWEPLSKVKELYNFIGKTSVETLAPSLVEIPTYELNENDSSLEELSLSEEEVFETSKQPENLMDVHTSPAEVQQSPEQEIIVAQENLYEENSEEEVEVIKEPPLAQIVSPSEDIQIALKEALPRRKQIISGVVLVILLLTTWMLLPDSKKAHQFLGLTTDDHKRLSETISISKGLQVNLALQDENKVLWLATNTKGNFLVRLTLASITNKILSDEDIVIFSKSTLKNHIARFDNWELVKGKRFSPGYYNAEIYLYEEGLLAALKEFLKDFELFRSLLSTYKRNHKINQTVLLQGWSPSKFNKLLEDYITSREYRQQRPLLELKESYNTLLGLMDQMLLVFKQVIDSSKQPKNFLDEFNRKYASEISPVYQGIMSDNKKIHDDISDISQQKKNMYNEFLSVGKEVGGLVADIVVNTQNQRNLNSKVKKKLINELEISFSKQKNKINKNLNYLDKLLNKTR